MTSHAAPTLALGSNHFKHRLVGIFQWFCTQVLLHCHGLIDYVCHGRCSLDSYLCIFAGMHQAMNLFGIDLAFRLCFCVELLLPDIQLVELLFGRRSLLEVLFKPAQSLFKLIANHMLKLLELMGDPLSFLKDSTCSAM